MRGSGFWSVIFDEDYKIAYLNTASVGNAIPDSQMVSRGEIRNVSGSMGLCIDVYENRLEVKGIDFRNDSEIDLCKFELLFTG